MAPIFHCILAVFLGINAVQGLKCYNCNSENSVQCKWGFTSFTYNTEECGSAGVFDNVIGPKCYKITAESKDGREYIARGCLPPATFGCSAMAKAVGWLSSSTSNDPHSLENLSCETCETDKCNSAEKVVAFTFIALILSAVAFLV
nr:uncharacterized protein LOC111510200 [Leptinotarsa decemlineata]